MENRTVCRLFQWPWKTVFSDVQSCFLTWQLLPKMQIGNMTKIIAQIINTKGGITNKGQLFFNANNSRKSKRKFGIGCVSKKSKVPLSKYFTKFFTILTELSFLSFLINWFSELLKTTRKSQKSQKVLPDGAWKINQKISAYF